MMLPSAVSEPLLFLSMVEQSDKLIGRLYIIHPGDSLPTPLTDPDQDVWSFGWSPDAQWIAFQAAGEIYVMDTWGNNKLEVTPDKIPASEPVWSPDSRRIAFNCSPDRNPEICVVDRDGSNFHRLTDNQDTDYVQGWSPDGTMLLFVSDRDRPPTEPQEGAGVLFKGDVWVMRADGSEPRRLTDGKSGHWDPTWSPDGQYIAFMSDKSLKYGVHVIRPEGQDERQVGLGGIYDFPQWFADSQTLLYRQGPEVISVSLQGEKLNNWATYLVYDPMLRQVPCRPSPESSQVACLHFPGIVILDAKGNWIAYLRGDAETQMIVAFQWSPVTCAH